MAVRFLLWRLQRWRGKGENWGSKIAAAAAVDDDDDICSRIRRRLRRHARVGRAARASEHGPAIYYAQRPTATADFQIGGASNEKSSIMLDIPRFDRSGPISDDF